MRRLTITLAVLLAAALALSVVLAQPTAAPQVQTRARPGDPPIASLITVSVPDSEGMVTISGAAGAVFPGAQVAIRNLYTEQVVYVGGGITGSFNTQIYGPGGTPFWINSAEAIPASVRNVPGSLPGGPGVIVYGGMTEAPAASVAVTSLITDGALDDWTAYPQAKLLSDGSIYALANRDSLVVAITADEAAGTYGQVRVVATLSGTTYAVAFDPRQLQAGTLSTLGRGAKVLGSIALNATQQGSTIEARIPLTSLDSAFAPGTAITLNRIEFVLADGSTLKSYAVEQPVPAVDEVDGVVYSGKTLGSDAVRFSVSGAVAQGASTWTARGRIQSLTAAPGDAMVLELDVTMDVPTLAPSLVGLRMSGQLGWQPIVNAHGNQAAGGLDSNNGWSSLRTRSGIPIDNVRGDFWLGSATAEPQNIIRKGNQLLFGLRFAFKLPDDLPAGLYTPYFVGKAQVGDGDVFAWTDNGVLGSGEGISRVPLTRLPLVVKVGSVSASRLAWALFYDNPSGGKRGILANEDWNAVGLSNRVRYDDPVYILPPGTYPLEPYLLNQLPNASDTSAAPLIPLLTPGGRLTAQVKRPDGKVDDLGSASIVQNWITSGPDTTFGANSPVNVYRLTTLNDAFEGYKFDQYGQYTITLTGNTEDIWNNRYDGGGTYTVWIAEPLDLLPGVLPGTPFEVGNVFNTALHIAPNVPADVSIGMTVYPLDGSPQVQQSVKGKANAFGYFSGSDSFTLDKPGEYVVEYTATYTDPDGKVWMGDVWSAGVIANPKTTLVTHGRRGLDNYIADLRPAWYTTRKYPAEASTSVRAVQEPILNIPYNAGDVAWLPDGSPASLKPVIQVQDLNGAYRDWLLGTLPNYQSPFGVSMSRLASQAELPLLSVLGGESPFNAALLPDLVVNQAYAYISVVRPGVTVRQFVQGSDDPGLPVAWNSDDPYNGQMGAGFGGDRPGDYAFLFGGAVVRNAEAAVDDASIYAALSVTTDDKDPLGARIYPPYRGEMGGADGGALLTLDGDTVETFFQPTAVQPGQILMRGEPLAIAGQVAPPIASNVTVTITTPSKEIHQFSGMTNAIGYFYDPANDFAVDELGVWTVEISVTGMGTASAGALDPRDRPTGGVLGALNGQFAIYVVPPDVTSFEWNKKGDTNSSLRPASGFPFSLKVPSGWKEIHAYYSVTMPGYLLDSGELPRQGSTFIYAYNPGQLSKAFPNLESDGKGSGASASDVVTITFVLVGKDANDTPQVQARTFTVLHDQMVSILR